MFIDVFINKNKTKICSIVISIAAVLIFESCSPTTQSGYGPSSEKPKENNGNNSDPGDPVSPPSDLSTSNQFFVGVDTKTTYPYYASQMGSYGVPQYGTKCAIDKSSSTKQDISCVIEAPELSLWYGGMKLALNIPEGMCEYLKEIPYWYYNQEPGVGPDEITIEKTSRPNIPSTFRCSVDGSALSTCTGYSEVYFVSSGDALTEKCVYDYTGNSSSGGNCCLGEYTLNQINIVYDDNGVPQTSTSQVPRVWGKNIAGCVGGQGRTNWQKASLYGYPLPIITELRSGNKLKSVVINSPAETIDGYRSVIPVANYYTVSSTAISSLHYHTGVGTASGLSSTIPFYVQPLSDRDGSLVPSGNAAYKFQCLDDFYEIKHSISLYVRQWDVLSPFLTYKNTGALLNASPWDVTGTEGVSCDGITNPSEPCDDHEAADNIPRSLGGGYVGNRFLFFPNHPFN